MSLELASVDGGRVAQDAVRQPVDRILRAGTVCELMGLGKLTLYRRSREGLFPAARRISGNSMGWLLSEVNEWILGLPEWYAGSAARNSAPAAFRK